MASRSFMLARVQTSIIEIASFKVLLLHRKVVFGGKLIEHIDKKKIRLYWTSNGKLSKNS